MVPNRSAELVIHNSMIQRVHCSFRIVGWLFTGSYATTQNCGLVFASILGHDCRIQRCANFNDIFGSCKDLLNNGMKRYESLWSLHNHNHTVLRHTPDLNCKVVFNCWTWLGNNWSFVKGLIHSKYSKQWSSPKWWFRKRHFFPITKLFSIDPWKKEVGRQCFPLWG